MNRYLLLLALVAVATPAQALYVDTLSTTGITFENLAANLKTLQLDPAFSESALFAAQLKDKDFAAAMARAKDADTQIRLENHALDQKIVTGAAITFASVFAIAITGIIVEWYKNLDVQNARRAQEIARIKQYIADDAARAARNEEKAQAEAKHAQEIANAKHTAKVALAPEFQKARTQAAIAHTQHNIEQRKALDAANIEVMKAKAAQQQPVAQDTNNQEGICISSKTTITATA